MSPKELIKMSLDNGVTLAYRLSHSIDKSLPTIVMHHAFLMDSRFFDRQLKDVRYSSYNLISIDAHGHGETTGRGKDFTLWDTALDTLQLLTKLGINQFYVLGTTQGGCIALRMALIETRRIKGLILLGTAVSSASEQAKINARKSRDKWCETEIPSDEAIVTRAVSFGGPTRVDEKVFGKLKEMWIKRYAGPEGYDPAVNCLLNRDAIEDKLDQINVPTLVLHGADDKMFPPQEAKEWSAKLPKLWKFEIVERGVHHLSLTEPGEEVIARLIPEFIKETS
jgi:pimeloyl-ACP methyl ester carboxylesterase